jgi:hypothetical protein
VATLADLKHHKMAKWPSYGVIYANILPIYLVYFAY